jgi:ribonuclease J
MKSNHVVNGAAVAPTPDPDPDELVFLPLGGSGEIGMNLNLYAYAGQWLMVDCGVTFSDGRLPGIDVILPDPGHIVERRDRLAGLVVTHAHEDHIGAIPYLWSRIQRPIYATPFTASVLRAKLAEAGLSGRFELIEVPMSGRFAVGPFEIELVTLTHSIPEPNALIVRTPLGTVVHTGDWKLDPEPLVGDTTDEAALRRAGDEGVLAMVCDSTNAMLPGESGSEADVGASLLELLGRYRNRIVVACFASNVARLRSIAEAAARHGRNVALIGRSLWRIEKAARENGYLDGLSPFVTEHDAGFLPRDKALYICTGSQGEPRSALARIAQGDHPEVALEAGDVAIFSSRRIPGNEIAIARLQNQLARLGVEVVTDTEHFVHVSGHPARDELIRMYQMVRPKIAVPVHGELRHMRAHAALAEQCQVPHTVVVENGDMVRLAPGAPEVLGKVPAGRLAVDGTRIVPIGGTVLRSRQRLTHNGAALATIVLDGAGRLLAAPQVTLRGLGGEDGVEALSDGIGRALDELTAAERRDDERVREAARIAVRRAMRASHGKKPETDIHVVRV